MIIQIRTLFNFIHVIGPHTDLLFVLYQEVPEHTKGKSKSSKLIRSRFGRRKDQICHTFDLNLLQAVLHKIYESEF